MKYFFLVFFFFLGFIHLYSKDIKVSVNNLEVGDSALIIVQKSSEIFLKEWVYESLPFKIFNLEDGKWSVKIDVNGYTYPSEQIVSIPEDKEVIFFLTKLTEIDFTYTWEDDGSAVGHATHRYVNEPSEIIILDDTISIPNDYSAIKLLHEYGIILSNEEEKWSKEDSYRLYKTFNSFPYNKYGEGHIVDPKIGASIRGIFTLTKQELPDDIIVIKEGDLKYIKISQSAFTYASPLIVTVDGIKGKFFSKRLYHSLVKLITDFGRDSYVLNWLAKEKFGIEFLGVNKKTEELMKEDQSNFQEFYFSEKIEILSMFEELPEGFHKQDGLKYLVRRIDGQNNPKYPSAAAIAWTGLNTIEFMSKAFSNQSIDEIRRLILHEKAHFLWEYTFNSSLKEEWIEIGGWFEDPTSNSGWSTYNTTEFVSPYAHAINPNEDMAESIAVYLTNPDALKSVSLKKFEFIQDKIMHGTRYISKIREDLTFTVYNLFPDYIYPGKVVKVEVMVEGKPDEDKKVSFRITLNSKNPEIDGGSFGYIRFSSLSGTIHDVGLRTENGGSSDSVLIGSTIFNKHEKSGYWKMDYFRIGDIAGNYRFENTSTIGMKLFIQNPLEDIYSPQYNGDYKIELVEEKLRINGYQAFEDQNGDLTKALKISFSHYDKSPVNRGYVRLKIPNSSSSEVYNRDLQSGPIINPDSLWENGYNSNKFFKMYLPIFDYFQSGSYSTTFSFVEDIAGNTGVTYHVIDTSDFLISPDNKGKIFKEIRDSIFIETTYPDYVKPEIDINNINISATPTNPVSPDGETKVEIDLLARDKSDFSGKESGVYLVSFVLRDPLGGRHGYQTGNSTMNNPDLNYYDSDLKGDSLWSPYHFNLLLPKGSPPGKWGLESAEVIDRAGNRKQYSFTEFIRFDVIESSIKLNIPATVRIHEKYVNEKNVEGINATISCNPCSGLNFEYSIYSLLGGNVVRGSGVFETDSVSLKYINTEGLNDGILIISVNVLDLNNNLISVAKYEFLKDTERPKSYYFQTNLENEGNSSWDDFLIDVIVESLDLGGSYSLYYQPFKKEEIYHGNIEKGRQISKELINDTIISLGSEELQEITNGYFALSLIVKDSVENEGEIFTKYFYKQDQVLIESDYLVNCSNLTISPVWLNPPSDTVISCKEALQFIPLPLNYSLGLEELCDIQGTVEPIISSNFGHCGQTWTVTWVYEDISGNKLVHNQNIYTEEKYANMYSLAPSKNKINEIENLIENFSNQLDNQTDLVTIYPNPFYNFIIVDFKTEFGAEKIDVIDSDGRLVNSIEVHHDTNIRINLSSMKAGIYIIKAIGGDSVISKRVIKLY